MATAPAITTASDTREEQAEGGRVEWWVGKTDWGCVVVVEEWGGGVVSGGGECCEGGVDVDAGAFTDADADAHSDANAHMDDDAIADDASGVNMLALTLTLRARARV